MRRTATELKKNYIANNKRDEFITRFFDDCIGDFKRSTITLQKGVTIFFYDIILSDNQQGRDEISLLRYLPYEDGNPYVSLVFIPEIRNAKDEEQKAVQIAFSPDFFNGFNIDISAGQPFKSDRSVEQAFMHDTLSRESLDFINHFSETGNDLSGHIKLFESALHLLRYSIKAFFVPDQANYLPACGFLNNSSEREKIAEAQKIIINQLDNPLTIRELSKMVGINECYLKKGFKAMFGQSIHEYLQRQRIEKAKAMLQQKGMTVNEVALELGFGSASHFSTSFKKIAGIKPCELLQ